MLSDVELLRRLVAIDSTSAVSNLPIADTIATYVEPAGAAIEYVRSPDQPKANLLIRFGPDSDGRGLILSGHMDAVPAVEAGWDSDPFTLTERDGRYFGRGTADMKGFLAAATNAAMHFASSTLRAPLILLFTFDEEVGTLGARQFVDSWNRTRPLPGHCVIGEPTSFRAVRAHKGHLKLRITTQGRSAHSGYPHLGENAIEKARPVLDGLSALRTELQSETAHADLFPDAPYVPLNIATILGGTAINIVPDHCEIDVGIRLLPGMSDEDMIPRVRRAVGNEAAVEMISSSPPLLLGRDAEIYRAVQPFAIDGPPSVSFATDAGWLQTLGIDCVIFGPGSIEVAHRPNEFIPKDELERAGGVLRQLIERFCL